MPGSMQDLSSSTRGQTHNPAVGEQSVNHWNTREVPSSLFFFTGRMYFYFMYFKGFPDGSRGKETTCNAGNIEDMSLIPGSGRSPGGGKWQPIPEFLPER